MELVFSYLLSWIGGGVLLAGDLLLAQSTSSSDSSGEGTVPAPTVRPKRAWHVLAAMAAVGFGGAGLALEAVGSLAAAQRPAVAACAGLTLLVVAAWLARPRRPELV